MFTTNFYGTDVIINDQSTVPPLHSSLKEDIAYMAPDILQPDGGGCLAAAKLILQRTNLFAKRGLSEDRNKKYKCTRVVFSPLCYNLNC